MNYAKFIAALYLSFIGLMGTLVYKSLNQNIDLVTPDYYKKELEFQQEIHAKESANALSEQLKIELNQDKLQLSFPEEFHQKNITGKVHIYCAWNAKNDHVISFKSVQQQTTTLNLPALPKGKYDFIVNWQDSTQSYLTQKSIQIR